MLPAAAFVDDEDTAFLQSTTLLKAKKVRKGSKQSVPSTPIEFLDERDSDKNYLILYTKKNCIRHS